MRTTYDNQFVQSIEPGSPFDIPPLVPPRTPSPEAPPLVAPTIYVQKSVQWEYRQIVYNLSKEAAPTAAELNSLGKDGWELAGVVNDTPFAYFYFKRWMA